jgi:hypothetical protein
VSVVDVYQGIQVLRIVVVRFVSRTGEPVALVHLLSSPDGSPEDLDTSAIIDNMLPDNSASNSLHKKD